MEGRTSCDFEDANCRYDDESSTTIRVGRKNYRKQLEHQIHLKTDSEAITCIPPSTKTVLKARGSHIMDSETTAGFSFLPLLPLLHVNRLRKTNSADPDAAVERMFLPLLQYVFRVSVENRTSYRVANDSFLPLLEIPQPFIKVSGIKRKTSDSLSSPSWLPLLPLPGYLQAVAPSRTVTFSPLLKRPTNTLATQERLPGIRADLAGQMFICIVTSYQI